MARTSLTRLAAAALSTVAFGALGGTAEAAQRNCGPHVDSRPGAASVAQLEAAEVCLINNVRARHGMRRLRRNERLSRAARSHSRDMVQRQYFEHTSPAGRDVVDRLLGTGYLRSVVSWVVGENLAWGGGSRSTPEEILVAWMNSPGHRANILKRRFREIGIGVVEAAPVPGQASSATYTTTFGAAKRR